MTTRIMFPDFGSLAVADWRQIKRNNRGIKSKIDFEIWTTETWLPLILSQAGFFPSNGEVKKNRPDCWRDLVPGETVELGWASVLIFHDGDTPLEAKPSN